MYPSGEKICTDYPSVRTIEVQSTYNADIRNHMTMFGREGIP